MCPPQLPSRSYRQARERIRENVPREDLDAVLADFEEHDAQVRSQEGDAAADALADSIFAGGPASDAALDEAAEQAGIRQARDEIASDKRN